MKRISTLDKIFLQEKVIKKRRKKRLPSVIILGKINYDALIQEMQTDYVERLHGLKIKIIGTKGIRIS